MVDAQPSRKANTTPNVIPLFETLMARQIPDPILNTLRDLGQSLPWLDVLLRPLPDLPVDLRSLSILGQEVVVHAVEVALLLAGRAVVVLISVLVDFTFGELPVREEVGHGHGRRRCLPFGCSGLLLLLWLLLLFLRRWSQISIPTRIPRA